VVHAALPGEFLLSEAGMAAAAGLAGALFGSAPQSPPSPCCTQCGGAFFEFRGGNRVYCLLCGAGGRVAWAEDGVRLETAPPQHSWRGPEARKAHGAWLIGMKERYRRERERLKEACRPYAGGNFI
jgi:hypothetical protein